MRISTWLALGGMLAATACWGPKLDTRTYALNNLAGDEAARLLGPYVYGDREGAAGQMSFTRVSVTVRETPDNLEKIARVLAEYDRAKPSVQLTFQIIQADGAATTDPAIADVEAVLRTLFRFKGYRLVAEAVAIGVEGSDALQRAAGPGGPYRIGATILELRGAGDSATVRLRAGLDLPGVPGALMTTVTLRPGQTAVLGSTQTTGTLGTLILTVRPELVQ